ADQEALSISRHLDTSVAPYAQVTYSILPNVRITAGARYTTETKWQGASSFTGPTMSLCTLPPPYAGSGPCEIQNTNSYSDFDYKGGIDWNITPNVLWYFTVSHGFLAGGINSRSTGGAPLLPFRPETQVTYETGFKAELLDRRLRFNAAVYHSDVKDMQ